MSWPINPDAKPVPKPTPVLPDSVMQMFSMKGKVVLITGAGSGIGFAVAEAMAEAGADVAITYNSNANAVDKAETGLAKKYGVKAKAYQCKIESWEEVSKTVAAAHKEFGRIDVLIANAGTGFPGGILERPVEDWHKIVDINFNGVYYCAKAVGEIFKKQGSGNFIVTASMSGHIVNVPLDQGAYNACKSGVIHLAKSLAREWRDFARVNSVSPGFFDTNLGAAPQVMEQAFNSAVLGRQGDVKELKGVYLYLASDASTFTTGTDIIVDGGYTLP